MISTTFYVASRFTITALISVSFFEETVLRPIRSGPRKGTAGLVVSAFKSTIILILAADEAASMYLSNDTSAPSTGEHVPDATPRLLRTTCPACKLHQGTPDRHPPVNFVLPVPARRSFLQSSPSSVSSSPVFRSTMSHNITTLDLSYSGNCKRLSITSNTTLVACDGDRLKDVLLPSSLSSSPVFISTMPDDITTTLDLSHFNNCKRLSIASDTTLVACDDDYSKDVLLPSSLSSSPVFKSTMSHNITTLDLSIISDTSLVACDDDRLKDVLLLFSSSSSPVFRPTPNDITTTLDLSHFSNCKRPSIASDTTLVACDDDSNDIFSDKVNYAMPQPGVQAPAHTTDNVRIDVPASSTTIDIISPFCMPYVRPLVLVDKCQTMPTCTANRSVPGSVHLMDALLQTTNSLCSSPSVVPKDDCIHVEGVFTGTDEALDTKDVEHHIDTLPPCMPALITNNGLVIENALPVENALAIRNVPSHPLNFRPLALLNSLPMSLSTKTDTSPSESARPTHVLAQKTKAAASWLKPLILVTKYAADRLIPLPLTALPEKSRPYKLQQQKRKPARSLRMDSACHSIVRSRLRRHAHRIVGHLAQVCKQICVDQLSLMDGWVTVMAEVGLTSMLVGNHRKSPGSQLPLTLDAFYILEPGSRIKARLASLCHRTNAVVAMIPATTTFPPLLPRRDTC
ncbi:uncharacterized protein F5891DRAFT_1180385 [Suillus fuscotomentosus]|uniref:Uncharacterized protein n=1 Tax=Suillus fuscotomentosus TaxID=1912939 RepID=A0AAD4HWN1_9AGAM|nr:uncharacterized protein F5891DRAFT_1180385 [Suillus fuscotomentosus]KAG1908819.1 hypothetical protein F5891DRAFT_1180385 [Suillus fuscotomentosus]